MLESLSILTIIAIVADLISIGGFLYSILIKRNFTRILNKILLIVILFLLAVFTYFFSPEIAYGIDISLLLYLAGILYLVISAIGLSVISYIIYSSSYTILEYIINIVSIVVPLLLGVSLFWLIQKPLDFFASILLYVSLFHFILMSRNYIYSKFSQPLNKETEIKDSVSTSTVESVSIVDKVKNKVSSIRSTVIPESVSKEVFSNGKVVHNGFNLQEFWLELCYGLIPILLGYTILIVTNEVYRDRFYEAVRFEEKSFLLTKDTTKNNSFKETEESNLNDFDNSIKPEYKLIIENFFKALNAKDKEALEGYLADQIESFNQWENISKDSAMANINTHFWNKRDQENRTIFWDTVEEYPFKNGGGSYTFQVNYTYINNNKNNELLMDVELILDEEANIVVFSETEST